MENNKSLFSFFYHASWIGLVPFLVLTIYNRPSADDLYLHYDSNLKGVFGAYYDMYTQISSRYTSLFVLFTITYFRIFLDYYFIIPLLLLGAMFGGLFLCLKAANTVFIQNRFSVKELLVVVRLYLLLYLVVMPEPASSFYWVSGAITHMLPVILLLFSIAFFIYSLAKKRLLILSVLFLFLAVGCNEMMAIYLLTIVFGLGIYAKLTKSAVFGPVLLLFIVVLCGNLILFLGVGQQNRAGNFHFESSFLYAVAASYLKYFLLVANLFASPFFWFCMLSLLLVFKRIFPALRHSIPFRWWAYYFLLVPLVFYFLVYLVSPAGVPERANNPLAFVILTSFSLMVCHLSTLLPELRFPQRGKAMHRVIVFSFLATILFSRNFQDALENQLSAPVYSRIFDNRIKQIEAAKKEGKKKVELSTYTKDWDRFVQTEMPAVLQKPIIKLVNPYPRIIFFWDDFDDPNWITSYAEYYGIDSIIIDAKTHLKFTLDQREKGRSIYYENN